jgi:hypothetical protein
MQPTGDNATMSPLEDANLAAAVALGWRVAELYSLVDDSHECSPDTLLPAHGSLSPADQLELQLRAAAGDAQRAGVTSDEASLIELIGLARNGAEGDHQPFRERLRDCHVEISKDLWATSESLGKAYELGNGISDTYGLVCRAYREPKADRAAAWRRVFDEGRIERIKKLLDDLQSRLDATAVTVVREQLDTWQAGVLKHVDADEIPKLEDVRRGLRRQTVIWRQLIAGDKEPEAYLGDDERAHIRDKLRDLAWKRYRFLVPPVLVGLAALVFFLPRALDWYQESLVQSGFASVVVAAVGALGITRASVVLTLRTRLHEWADLLWHRAVVSEVAQATLTLEQAFPAAPGRDHTRIAAATTWAAGRLKASVTPARTAPQGEA